MGPTGLCLLRPSRVVRRFATRVPTSNGAIFRELHGAPILIGDPALSFGGHLENIAHEWLPSFHRRSESRGARSGDWRGRDAKEQQHDHCLCPRTQRSDQNRSRHRFLSAGQLFARVEPRRRRRCAWSRRSRRSGRPIGPPGPAGPAGPVGPPGPSAPSGFVNVEYVFGGMVPGTSVARAMCPPGTIVTGGGGFSTNGAGLQQNHPISDDSGLVAWGSHAIGWQIAASDWSGVQAYVVCVGP